MRVSQLKSRLTLTVGLLHLVYLGLLPALATFGLLYTYGYPGPLFVFLLIGGAAAVGVYVAVLFYYAPRPTSLGWELLVLLDGPACALLSLYARRVFPLGFAVEAFIVDGTAVWLSILVLAHGRALTHAATGWMLLALAATTSLVWPYFRYELWGQWVSLACLVGGAVEAAVVRFRQLERDEGARSPDKITVFIVILVLAWVASLISGNVLYAFKLKAASRNGW